MSPISYFLIGIQNRNGQLIPAGKVEVNGRLCPDAKFNEFFPNPLKTRDQVLKACRWVKGEAGVNWVEIELPRWGCQKNVKARVIAIR